MVAKAVELREITNQEGNRLLHIVRRGAGNIVTWRRAQIVLWAAQGYAVGRIAEIGFTSEDRVREVIHNFNRDGFSSLSPKYAGGRPHKFDHATRAELPRVALTGWVSRPAERTISPAVSPTVNASPTSWVCCGSSAASSPQSICM